MMSYKVIEEEGRRYISVPLYNETGKGSHFSEYERNVLEASEISGIPKVSKRTVGEEIYLMFAVSSYVSLREKFKREYLNIELFCNFFEELFQVYERMKIYLLDKNTISLDPDYIFFDEKTKKYIFLPIGELVDGLEKKYENLFTFFADICSVEEKCLLEYIFESFGTLSKGGIEEIEFVKEIANYKYKIKKEIEKEEENLRESFEEEIDSIIDEEPKIRGTFILGIILLFLSFWFAYVCEYEFKYGGIGMAAVLLAVGLMGYEVLKLIKYILEQKKM